MCRAPDADPGCRPRLVGSDRKSRPDVHRGELGEEAGAKEMELEEVGKLGRSQIRVGHFSSLFTAELHRLCQ